MKKIFILLVLAISIGACQKQEIILASAEDHTFLVYNQKIIESPIVVNDGFVMITESEKLRYLTKISAAGEIIWQNKLADLFNFSSKVEIVSLKLDKTIDNRYFLIVVHSDSIKYKDEIQHVQFIKFDETGNSVYNFQKAIIDGIDGEDDSNLFSFFSAYEDEQGNIVCLSKNVKWSSVLEQNVVSLQISKYSNSGELLSNERLVIPEIYEMWRILKHGNNQFSLIADSRDYLISGYKAYVCTIDDTGNLLDTFAVYLSGYLANSFVFNDDYYFITNSYVNDGSHISQYDKDGNSINNYDINVGNKQFVCNSVTLTDNEVYLVGVMANNIVEINRPAMSWAKLSNNTYTNLGEIHSIDATTGVGIFFNPNGSLTLLGKKNSFGDENIFVLKTKTDGTVLIE